MSRPELRSLYWRIGFGFIICVAGVIVVQSFTLLWLLNHSQATQGGNLTQVVSSDLGRLLTEEPAADIDQYVRERYAGPTQSFFAVLKNGKVVAAGKKKAPKRAIQAAIEEFERGTILAIPRAWQGEPYRTSAIVVDGQIVGAVAVVPETWVEPLARIAPMLVTLSAGLLVVGIVLSSSLIFRPAHRRLQEQQDVSIEGLFGRVAARHASEAADRNLHISTSIEPGAEILCGDRFRLEQALQNLAANALRHVRDGGSVVLLARVQDAMTVLSITDDGGGIASEHLPFVFDRFYKVDPARPRNSAGSGLGLSIVKAIVEGHGGTVSVSSEHDVATTFSISLPTGLPRRRDAGNSHV